MLKGVLESTPAQLAGPLSQATLVQVLRALFVGRLTGLLSFARDEENLGLRFLSGHIVSGTSGPVAGRLGEVLARSGVVSRTDLDHALELAAGERRRLGPVLVERRLATRAQIEDALCLQVRGVLFTAFFWRQGAFRFEPDDGTAAALEEVNLRLSTPELILEVINSVDQTSTIRHALGDLDRPLAAVEDPRVRLEGVTLSPGDAFVLSRADGTMTARQILEITPLPQESVERSLLSLLSVGVVEWRPRVASRLAFSPNHTVALSRDEVRAAIETRHASETESRRREIDSTFAALGGKTHHDVLGLAADATADEVREAYHKLTKRFHPDAAGELPGEQATRVRAIFMRISEAYNALRGSAPTARPGSRPAGPTIAAPAAAPPTPMAATPTPTAAVAALAAPSASAPRAAEDPGECLRLAQEALAERPWDALARAERLLDTTTGEVRRQAHLLKARAQLRNPISRRAGELELRAILSEAPDFVDALMVLGAFYKDRGLAARAASTFRKVLEVQPGHRRAADELRDLPRPEPGPMRFGGQLAAARA
jgi:hypothetical protein